MRHILVVPVALALTSLTSLAACGIGLAAPPADVGVEGEGEGSIGEGEGSIGEGEGSIGEGEGSIGEGEGSIGEGEGSIGEGEGSIGEGEGEGSQEAPFSTDDALALLRAGDAASALLQLSKDRGLPIAVTEGTLFVTTGNLRELAGDFDNWTPEPMNDEGSFAWIVKATGTTSTGQGYKFTDGSSFVADPLSRAYTWDNFGEMSLTSRRVEGNIGGRERHFDVSGFGLQPREVRVLFPLGVVTHVIYAHDGQNLFDRNDPPFGGWRIDDVLPDGVMVVGIDNTSDRFAEYTPVPDDIGGGGGQVGGASATYDELLENTVRPLIARWYGEPSTIGVMGSSLGGLVSFDIAERNASTYAFAASLSGTFGWGSLGDNVHNETLIERYENHAHTSTVMYLDSGGTASGCADLDHDGINDDVDAGDNSCETVQMRDTLRADGWQDGVDLFYVIQEGAQHNEASWASRVGNILTIFAAL